MNAGPKSLRTPADSLDLRHSNQKKQQNSARQFLARANQLVDEIEADRIATGVPALDLVEFLRGERHPPRPVACTALPARFRREPDIFLANVRFGRTRLFLSKFIGRLAWRWVGL